MALLTYRCNFKLSHGLTICNLFSFPALKLKLKQSQKPRTRHWRNCVWGGRQWRRQYIKGHREADCVSCQLDALPDANYLPCPSPTPCFYFNISHQNLLLLKISKIQNTLIFLVAQKFKHCQRHNGPRVLTPYLELTFQLELFKIDFSDTTWTGFKFGHQMATLALVQNLVTRWHHLH